MKTVILLSLMSLFACNDHKKEPVDDQTRTTSAIVVSPTLHDSHAAEPGVTNQTPEEPYVDQEMDMDVDEAEMSGARDAGVTPSY